MNELTPIKPADLVEEYIRLRDKRKVAQTKIDEVMERHYDARMTEIENELLEILNATGLDSIAGPSGTAYKAISVSVTLTDAREFRRHVIGSEQWDLLEWRPSKTAVNELVERNEPLPPGVNRSAFAKVNVRRKTS